jgi:tetratricopeptide (TPR) repeat protein
LQVGPLENGHYVAISPDGRWLATGSHGSNGFQVWRLPDATLVARPQTSYYGRVRFSPDGNWLMNQVEPCRLWEVGTWREARRIGGLGLDFSPDGRLLVVQDPDRVLRLVEIATEHTLARFESPDHCTVEAAAFSPDGSRLVVTTQDGPAVHVWDLRAIRRQLAGRGLDWLAPAFSEGDPAGAALPALPPLRVDLGPLAGPSDPASESPETLVERYGLRVQEDPRDADAYYQRALARIELKRFAEAIDDLTRAIRLRPEDLPTLVARGKAAFSLGQFEPAIADLEAALERGPDRADLRTDLAWSCNNRSWELANGPGSTRGLERALALARRAVELVPGEANMVNTLGVVLYRIGRYGEAVATLERSLAAGRGQFDGFDLFFLAMAHRRLGHRPEAAGCFDRAVRWVTEQKNLDPTYARELAAFHAEAEAVLAGPPADLPDDVFADPR